MEKSGSLCQLMSRVFFSLAIFLLLIAYWGIYTREDTMINIFGALAAVCFIFGMISSEFHIQEIQERKRSFSLYDHDLVYLDYDLIYREQPSRN